MELPTSKEDNCSKQSVAAAGVKGKVKADVDRKAKGGNSPNSEAPAARVVSETKARVQKKSKGDHQNKKASQGTEREVRLQ